MRKRTLSYLLSLQLPCNSAFTTIRRGFSARDNPSAMETYVAKTARRLSVLASKRNAANPFLQSPEVLAEARAHFADHCAICHGNARGKTQIGQNLYPKTPDMRLPQTQNLTDWGDLSPAENLVPDTWGLATAAVAALGLSRSLPQILFGAKVEFLLALGAAEVICLPVMLGSSAADRIFHCCCVIHCGLVVGVK